MLCPRFCLLCHTPMFKATPLCDGCSASLWEWRRPLVRAEDGYVVRSLFRWDRESPRAMRWLARSMKRRPDRQLWREFAQWLTFAFPAPRTVTRIVPVPSHGPNHALGMALALSERMDLSVENVLLPGEIAQKTLNRRQRQQLRFGRLGAQGKDFTGVLIVDDIVTTGATVGAAYRALGRPGNCEVWCLMDRRRSCRTDSWLL